MYLSRFENPLKRTTNEKGEVKLLNHSKILLGLGGKWITSKVYTELYTVDLMDIKSKVSYIDRSRDYKLFTRPVHKILTKSTLYKLQNYFTSNQKFSLDKKKHPIKLTVIPPETTTMDLPDQWTVNANVKELLHQLSSVLYRCRDGASFSKKNRNNLSFDELYKLFDWDVYRCEQHQCTSTSILERNLHQKHKDTYSQHTQMHKSIGKDGVVETLFPDPHYTAETHMPLSTTPRLDLYFTQSELTAVSLLLTACVEHTCRRQSEYCLLCFEHRPLRVLLLPRRNNASTKKTHHRRRRRRTIQPAPSKKNNKEDVCSHQSLVGRHCAQLWLNTSDKND